jgi:predicted PurR-regulated permease PerM
MIDRKFINRFLYITLPFISIYIITLVLEKYDIFAILSGFLGVITPLIIAYVLAVIVNPLVNVLQKKLKYRGLSILAVILIAFIFVAIFLRLLVPIVAEQIAAIIEIFPKIQALLIDEGNSFIESLTSIGIDLESDEIAASLQNQIEGLSSVITSSFTNLSSFAGNIIGGIVSSIFNAILVLTLFIYLLIDLDSINKTLVKFVPKKHRDYFINIMREISVAINEYFKAMFIIMSIVFVLVWIGFSIVGVPNAFVLAVIVAVTNLIPYVGPYIGAIPAVLVALTSSFNVAILVLVVIVVVQQIDGSILNPYFMKKSTHLHPVIIMTGIIVFSYFMGLVGILIAIPSLSIIKIVITRVNEKFKLYKFE